MKAILILHRVSRCPDCGYPGHADEKGWIGPVIGMTFSFRLFVSERRRTILSPWTLAQVRLRSSPILIPV